MAESREDALLAALPALLKELAASNVVELEVSSGEARLYLRQRTGPPPAAVPGPASAPPTVEATAAEEGLLTITTPLSGMFYASSSPSEPAYVQEGDVVEPGQVVGLIEAMKVFNEIKTEAGGVVVKMLVPTGTMVQSGTALITIRPREAAPSG